MRQSSIYPTPIWVWLIVGPKVISRRTKQDPVGVQFQSRIAENALAGVRESDLGLGGVAAVRQCRRPAPEVAVVSSSVRCSEKSVSLKRNRDVKVNAAFGW